MLTRRFWQDKDEHRDIHGGSLRAAVFGMSDGLVSNLALILGMVGASSAPGAVRAAGLAGLVAGALSMASGEWVSVKASNELVLSEVERERRQISGDPDRETQELSSIYQRRGVPPDLSDQIAKSLMRDPQVALETHAREELGVDPQNLPSPMAAAWSSLGAFAVGALVPLVAFFFASGWAAASVAVGLAVVAASVLGTYLSISAGRMPLVGVMRQVLTLLGASGLTLLVGSLAGSPLG